VKRLIVCVKIIAMKSRAKTTRKVIRPERKTERPLTPTEILQLPKEERQKYLDSQFKKAKEYYKNKPEIVISAS
jgi:hypothetical protein